MFYFARDGLACDNLLVPLFDREGNFTISASSMTVPACFSEFEQYKSKNVCMHGHKNWVTSFDEFLRNFRALTCVHSTFTIHSYQYRPARVS